MREAIEAVYRAESRRILATLIRLLGDFDLAEEAMQDAFEAHTVYTLDTAALMKAHWQILDLSTVLNDTFIL